MVRSLVFFVTSSRWPPALLIAPAGDANNTCMAAARRKSKDDPRESTDLGAKSADLQRGGGHAVRRLAVHADSTACWAKGRLATAG
jgi:hypothetical protein